MATDRALRHVKTLHGACAQHKVQSSRNNAIERTFDQYIVSHLEQVQSFSDNLETLLSECTSIRYLLEQVATSKNQTIARRQGEHVMLLTKSTVDDSTTVRVITVISLVYVSCSAAAVSCQSMNFHLLLTFSLDNNGYSVLQHGSESASASFASSMDLPFHRSADDLRDSDVLAMGGIKTKAKAGQGFQ